MRPRRLRRLLALVGCGAILAGTGTGIARADIVDDYVADYAHIVCEVLDEYPTLPGLEGILLAVMDDGLTPEAAGQAVARSVIGLCPEYLRLLERFVAKHEQAGTKW